MYKLLNHTTMSKFKIGTAVYANTKRNGYNVGGYHGQVAGYTATGRIIVRSFLGTRVHAADNVHVSRG